MLGTQEMPVHDKLSMVEEKRIILIASGVSITAKLPIAISEYFLEPFQGVGLWNRPILSLKNPRAA
jgi:hypothetical protein